MGLEQPLFTLSRLTAADLSTKQFYAVKETSSGLNLCGAGDQGIGILQNDPTSGTVASVMTAGMSKAVYGASVTKGQSLMSDASGKLIPQTGNSPVLAIALDTGSLDEIRSVLLTSGPGSGVAASYSILSFPITLANVANGDVVTDIVPGFAGVVVSAQFVVTTAATTAAKATTLNLEINATNVTGGVIALTSANCTPLGHRVAGTAVTAANTFGATDTLSVEAASTTAFVEGEGVLLITLKSA